MPARRHHGIGRELLAGRGRIGEIERDAVRRIFARLQARVQVRQVIGELPGHGHGPFRLCGVDGDVHEQLVVRQRLHSRQINLESHQCRHLAELHVVAAGLRRDVRRRLDVVLRHRRFVRIHLLRGDFHRDGRHVRHALLIGIIGIHGRFAAAHRPAEGRGARRLGVGAGEARVQRLARAEHSDAVLWRPLDEQGPVGGHFAHLGTGLRQRGTFLHGGHKRNCFLLAAAQGVFPFQNVGASRKAHGKGDGGKLQDFSFHCQVCFLLLIVFCKKARRRARAGHEDTPF